MPDDTLSLFGSEPGWMICPETKLERRFVAWARENPDLLREFEVRALRLHRAGADRIGVKAIAEVVRYDHTVSGRGDEYKVNNSLLALVSRWLLWRHPELSDAIETRRRVA